MFCGARPLNVKYGGIGGRGFWASQRSHGGFAPTAGTSDLCLLPEYSLPFSVAATLFLMLSPGKTVAAIRQCGRD